MAGPSGGQAHADGGGATSPLPKSLDGADVWDLLGSDIDDVYVGSWSGLDDVDDVSIFGYSSTLP